ncbi:hypothetical protein F2Q70_00042014 [Brassica cretica]|uniref:Sugar phosphate transporter domain-containing protein n=1 Tax=Brassica cretica TaxID=69181 RepID=A0A8S9K8A6_BRACR|nr:hypothetical protein F2Q70_00042014 [Brassica cretica]
MDVIRQTGEPVPRKVKALELREAMEQSQNLISCLVVALLKLSGVVSVEKFNWKLIRVWMPVNVIFVGMLISGMYSLKYINVAMVTILKNATNIITAIGELYMFRKRQNNKVWAAMFMMIISAISGGITDLTFNAVGYTWQTANCVLTASYSLTLRRVMDKAKQSTKSGSLNEVSMVLLNNLLSLPFGIILIILLGEWRYVISTDVTQDAMFWVAATASGFLGLAISFTSMWFLHQTGPTTYSLVGSLNKVPISLSGLVLFNVLLSLPNLFSILFGLFAGVVFARAKIYDDLRKVYMLWCYQNLISCLVVALLKFSGVVSVERFNWKLIRVWMPVNVIFVGMLISGMYSLKYINVAMVTILKNATNIITAIGELYMFRKRQNNKVWAAMFMMIISAISGGITDLTFNAVGYTWQTANCVLTASYSLTLRRVMDKAKQSTKSGSLNEVSMVLLNNLLSLPFGIILIILLGEWRYVIRTDVTQDAMFWVAATLSGFLGLAISFTSMWFLHQTGPTTYSLVGSLNKVPISLSGLVLFNVPLSLPNLFSILFGLFAGVVFARAKMS